MDRSFQCLNINRTMLLGPARVVASPIEDDSGEFTFPVELVDESVQPALLDASLSSNTRLSEHVRINHVVSLGKPFFRLDPYLVECIELTEEDFPGVVDVSTSFKSST